MPIDQINWRSEFDLLRPYIEGRGGVVHVRYRGGGCASDSFSETLKSAFDNFAADGPRVSLRIDPDFFTTHYLGDVLQAIASKVGCTLEPSKSTAPTIGQLVVGSGNDSDGDMNVDANVHVHTSDYSDAPALRDRRVATVCKAVREFLKDGHFMIVINDAPSTAQVPFWRDLWEKGLKDLVEQGLFLVKMIDDEKDHYRKHPDEPEPERRADLPLDFDEERQKDAIQDLANILIKKVEEIRKLEMTLEDATQSVRSFVYSHKRSISRLHTEWSGVMIALVRDAR